MNITNFSIIKEFNTAPKTLNTQECYDLCKDTLTTIQFQPFILLGLSLIFSVVSWYITSNYDSLSNKFPDRINQIQGLYEYCSFASLICQSSLGFWIFYVLSHGIY